MENSKVLKTIFFLLGLPLIVDGIWRLTMPVAYYDFNGLILGSDVGMLSEARGAGGMILISGILILLGAFLAKLRFTSTVLSILVFLSFGFARLLGIVMDGMPGEKLIQGIIGEFVMGSIGVFVFLKYRKKSTLEKPYPNHLIN